jgi:hypothetical protein
MVGRPVRLLGRGRRRLFRVDADRPLGRSLTCRIGAGWIRGQQREEPWKSNR